MKTPTISTLSKALTAFIIFSALAALAATTLYQRNGISTFAFMQDPNGNRTVQRSQENFDVRRDWDPATDAEVLYLISSNKKTTEYFDAEGLTGTIDWNVRRGPRFENLLWNKSEQATELNVHWNQMVLTTGLGGCCAEMTGYRLYNIKTGRLLMSFNDFGSSGRPTVQPFSLEVPNSSLATRYVGIISQDSTRDRDFVPPLAGKSAAILIKYANESLKQKIQIDMTAAPNYGISVMDVVMEKNPQSPNSDKIEIRDNETTLWNIDGSANPADIGGVQLKVTLNAGQGDKTLIIPIKNDQLDLGSASLPVGVSINAVQ